MKVVMDRHNHIQLSGRLTTVSARSIHSSQPVRVVHLDGDNSTSLTSRNEPASRVDQGTADDKQASDSIMEVLYGIQERLEQIDLARSQSLGELQQLAVRLSIAVAESVVRHELQTDATRLESLVSLAIEQLQTEEAIRIHVSQQDQSRLESIVNLKPPDQTLSVHVDPTLKPGDFRVEGGTYGLESLVSDQLQSIQDKLLESLEDAQTERRQAAGDNSGLGRFPNRRQGT